MARFQRRCQCGEPFSTTLRSRVRWNSCAVLWIAADAMHSTSKPGRLTVFRSQPAAFAADGSDAETVIVVRCSLVTTVAPSGHRTVSPRCWRAVAVPLSRS